MAEAPIHNRISLHGYRDSVYSWVARLVLIEKNIRFDWVEVDPFSSAPLESYLKLNPFRR
ncbi:MAG: glutathione S-transferase family protein, partial [Gammaproteobacteria bacterium]|nr:glutathione S-transferase family protein [Gammaproteobacteria bacterium]